MENLNLALVSSPKPLLLGHSSSKNVFTRRKPLTFGRFCVSANSSSSLVTRAASKSHPNLKSVQGKPTVHTFASISSSNSQETTSVGVSPQLSPPPPSTVGSPLFWIGVGVGFSALFSVVASRLKKYAMQQAFKTMMGQMNTQNNPFESGTFSSGSPFPFPNPSASGPARSAGFAGNQSQATSTRSASQSTVTVDIPATKVEAVAPALDINVKDEVKVKNEPKKSEVKVVVLFDAMMSGFPFPNHKENAYGIDIVFSSETSADTWVEKEVRYNYKPLWDLLYLLQCRS